MSVFDVLGRRVQTVGDARYPAGDLSLPLRADGLAPGVYFVRVTDGTASTSTAFTVTR